MKPIGWHTTSKSASNPMASPVNSKLLHFMHLKAACAVLCFAAVCTATTLGIVHLIRLAIPTYPQILQAVVLAYIAAEIVFFDVWRAKLRLFNQQPLPFHRPTQNGFNPRQAYDKFVVEQHKLSKWICIKAMLSKWFGGVPAESIKLGNVAELVAYGFWYQTREEFAAAHGYPAEDLARELQAAWGITFEEGYDPEVSFMAHLWQPLRCNYRPLVFYLGIELVFLLKHFFMLAMGFKYTTCAGFDCYIYDHGIRRDPAKVPILFQHGVGLGLLPYALFVARLASTGHPVAAVECAHLGMRWIAKVPDAEQVVDALVDFIKTGLGWPSTCIAGHSYGTFYASRLLQRSPELVHSVCLIDPVTFNMFTGKLIETFVYKPLGSSLITWFIARDIHHAASVCRSFFWSQLNLWPDQLPERTLVVLSDSDELVPVKETVLMLKHEAPQAVVLHHPSHFHADFIKDIPWQDVVVQALVNLLDTGVCQTTQFSSGNHPELALDQGSNSLQLEQLQNRPSDRSDASDATGVGYTLDARQSTNAMGTDVQGNNGLPPTGKTPRRRRKSVTEAVIKSSPAAEFQSPSQTHARSDSASSYDNLVSRLRPKPHRNQHSQHVHA